MLIYEVNLTVDGNVTTDFSAWLREHIREMLKLDGFEAAALYVQGNDLSALPGDKASSGPRHWTVHYQIESRDHLRDYLDTHADRMRQDGVDRFEGQFSAERRVLEQQRSFSRHNPDRAV